MSARFVARWIADHELWLLALIAGPLMFPERLGRAAALAALLAPLPWLCRWWAHGYLTRRTPLDLCILGLMIMVPVSVWVSVDLTLTVPKLCGIFLGFVTYYAVVNGLHSARAIWLGAGALVLMGVVIAFISMIGTDWPSAKIFALQDLYELLPRLVDNIPRSSKGGFQPNEVGGTLAIFSAYTLVLLMGVWHGSSNLIGRQRSVIAGALAFAALFMLAILLMTQSRGAYIAMTGGVLLLTWLWCRRLRWVLALVVLGGVLGALWVVGPTGLADLILVVEVTNTSQSRFEIWQRAVYMIQDFPFTGVGLASFPRVGDLLYPLFTISSYYEGGILHAHNLFLQVAVDLGLPGLVAYVGWLITYTSMVLVTCRQTNNRLVWALAVGLGCSIIVYLFHSMVNLITLWSKPGLLLWVMAGLLTAVMLQEQAKVNYALEDRE